MPPDLRDIGLMMAPEKNTYFTVKNSKSGLEHFIVTLSFFFASTNI